jgi:hypothetical protein
MRSGVPVCQNPTCYKKNLFWIPKIDVAVSGQKPKLTRDSYIDITVREYRIFYRQNKTALCTMQCFWFSELTSRQRSQATSSRRSILYILIDEWEHYFSGGEWRVERGTRNFAIGSDIFDQTGFHICTCTSTQSIEKGNASEKLRFLPWVTGSHLPYAGWRHEKRERTKRENITKWSWMWVEGFRVACAR